MIGKSIKFGAIVFILSMMIMFSNIPVVKATPASNLLNRAYVTSFSTGNVDVVNLSNNTVEKAKIQVGSQPNSAAFNTNGTQIFITIWSSDIVSVIDPATDTL